MDSIYLTITILFTSRIPLFYFFRIYEISWRYFGFKDTTKLVYVLVFSTILLIFSAYFIRGTEFIIPRSIIAIEFFISLFLILALRISKRLYLERYSLNFDADNTVIVARLDKGE